MPATDNVFYVVKFLKCCPSERVNEIKISRLIMSSLMSGDMADNQQLAKELRDKDTIDFLHFIRYLNIVYKSDINVRLKFLYGVSMNSK